MFFFWGGGMITKSLTSASLVCLLGEFLISNGACKDKGR